MRRHSVHTVCEEAACPNRWECYSRGVVTVLILGRRCTRRCPFCGIEGGRPEPPDGREPSRAARLARLLGLRHIVITSVTRDDLPDGGAARYRATVSAVKTGSPGTRVEVLVPDFGGEVSAVETVLEGGCDVFSHNMETVERLFPSVRPSYDYGRSLSVLAHAAEKGAVTKSGIMLGLGERMGEVRECLRHIRASGCQGITIGQYLRPSRRHRKEVKLYGEGAFRSLAAYARSLGFRFVASAPRVRSSYRVDCFFSPKADTIHLQSGRR